MQNKTVSSFLDMLQHPLRPRIERVRDVILSVDGDMEENIKWNAPNYSLGGKDFLTMRLQPKNAFQLIFHTGAKKLAIPPAQPLLKNDHRLIDWKSNDRGVLDVKEESRFNATEPHLASLVKAWIGVIITL